MQKPIHYNTLRVIYKDVFYHSKCFKLYKPIKEFEWQDATEEEINEEFIQSVKDRFKLE